MRHAICSCCRVLLYFLTGLYPLAAGAQPLHQAWSAQSLGLHPEGLSPALNDLSDIQWEETGHRFTQLRRQADGSYVLAESDPAGDSQEKILATSADLTPAGTSAPLKIDGYHWYAAQQKLLVFTHAEKVWRARTRGDYWIFDPASKQLRQLGKGLKARSLQFAKIAPDGSQVAYVSRHNLYVEDLQTGQRKQLTTDGTEKIINGTFDWAYEEELFCRDGFRWSPDSKSIAYWQVDASHIGDYLMLNTTDSVYSFVIPVQYPKVGYDPSAAKIGIVDLATAQTRWMHVPGDPVQHYLPRMEWLAGSGQLMVQQFNRKQDTCRLFLVDARSGKAKNIYTESDSAWIDLNYFWQYDRPGWDWIDQGKAFLWRTEKDGWRHVYRISANGKKQKCITEGPYDVMDIAGIDRINHWLYFYASPDNATQQYLYKVPLDGDKPAIRLSPKDQSGTHTYKCSGDAQYAIHQFSNHNHPPQKELVGLVPYQRLKTEDQHFNPALLHSMLKNPKSFFTLKAGGVEMDGWMVRPADFDSSKKYPVLFYVYGEPASCTVKDKFDPNPWFQQLASHGYVIISVDNPGTPAPKGRRWRKAIFQQIGTGNIRYQAAAARQIRRWPWVDSSRIAVWGWSGGGSSTQNLLFQYPNLYQTGMAVAGVSNLLFYDNIYEERYMGLLPEDRSFYEAGSSVNHVDGLEGNLLIVHGSGDDNVHYQNQEALINALVAAGKQFSMMEYPNRTHGISEGPGTTRHLYALLTHFLVSHCPPGAR